MLRFSTRSRGQAATDPLLYLPGDGPAREVAAQASWHELPLMIFAPFGAELGLRQCRKHLPSSLSVGQPIGGFVGAADFLQKLALLADAR